MLLFVHHSMDSARPVAEELGSAQDGTPVLDEAAWALSKVKISGSQWINVFTGP